MRRGLGFHARHSPGGAFSPLSLFPAGVNGAWYDPSDATTLFSDRAGTTPCGTPGGGSVVPVGLMLDKSQNGVGTNGAKRVNLLTRSEDFDNAAWTKTAVSLTAAVAPNGTSTARKLASTTGTWQSGLVTTGNPSGGAQTISIYAKAAEAPILQIATLTFGDFQCYFNLLTGVSNGTAGFTRTMQDIGNGWWRCSVSGTLTAGGNFIFIPMAVNSGLNPAPIGDGILVWGADLRLTSEASTLPLYQRIDANWYSTMAGNHAIAANDTTARPELRARVNLLTYSEQFDNAAWTKTGGTITANADTAPDGTLTADLLTGNGTTFVAVQQSSGTLGTGRASFYVKAGTETKCEIWPNLGSSLARFDLSAVTATNTGGSNAAITAVGNGWFRISVDSSTFNANVRLILGYGAPTLSTTMLLWGAQLTATNEFPANTYQRIVDANTYDAVGFPRYFVANGTSSAMSTPGNVNLSGTDKVTVFAGVRALQASVQIINELGTDTNSVNGSYVLYKNNNGVGFASRGTAINDLNNSSGTTPPVSLVLAGQSNIAAPSISLRSNGAQVLSSTATQGTGNFGTYPLFIGARNNSSLFFTGNIYSIIVVGSAVSAGQISATEQWVAGKTGITI